MEQIKGTIYKITSLKTNDLYLGYTITKLGTVLSKLKQKYNRYIKDIENGGAYYNKVFEIIKYKDVKIEIIKEYQINDRTELTDKFYQYIQENNINNYNKVNYK